MGGGSFSSDQSVAHATSTAQMVAQNKRARLTSIQAKGNASGSIIFKSGGASGTTIATYLFGTKQEFKTTMLMLLTTELD